MSKYHGVEMSLRTLKRRLRLLALKRRNANVNPLECLRAVTELVQGPGNLRGYRAIWHSNSKSFINKTNINYNIPMLKYKILVIAIKKFS